MYTSPPPLSLSLSLSLSLFSSSYEGGPATCAYWGARKPQAHVVQW